MQIWTTLSMKVEGKCKDCGTPFQHTFSNRPFAGTNTFVPIGWERADPVLSEVRCPSCIQKRESAPVCPHTPPHNIHQSAAGPIAVCKMAQDHLDNAIGFFQSQVAHYQEQAKKQAVLCEEKRIILIKLVIERASRRARAWREEPHDHPIRRNGYFFEVWD